MNNHLPIRPRRIHEGYALLLCLLVAAVCSIAVLGIFQTARFETLEVATKKNSSIADWSARAGTERAIAQLLSDPNLRGNLPPVQMQALVTTQITQNGQDLTVQSTALLNGLTRSHTCTFSIAQLQQRIAALPK